jgi:cytochrome c553
MYKSDPHFLIITGALFIGLSFASRTSVAGKKNLPQAPVVAVTETVEASAPPMPSVATTCIACHGSKGISPAPLWPNLAGQKREYLIKQINAFRDGSRKDPMMNPLAANLSEADIELIANYFSSLQR